MGETGGRGKVIAYSLNEDGKCIFTSGILRP